MKIIIIQPWISYRGAETVSVQQAYYLQKKGIDAYIACLFVDDKRIPEYSNEIKYILPPKFLSSIFRRNSPLLFLFGPLVLFLLVLFNAKKTDVLNAHNLPSVWVAVIVGRFLKIKTVWTVHSLPERVSWKNKKSYIDYLIWLIGSSRFDIYLCQRVDLILSVSKYVSDRVYARYKKPSFVLYPGIRSISTSGNLPAKIKRLRRENKYLFLQVATLHSQKRQEKSLYALKDFLNIEPSAAIIFAGDGPDREELERIVKQLDLKNNVYFAGYINQKDIGNYYKICDLHLLPSENESFASSPLEALTFGKLTIISKSSGVLEVLDKYAIYSDSTRKSILKGLKAFVKNKKHYDSLGIAGKAYIKSSLSWQKYTSDFLRYIAEDKDVPSTVYDSNYYQTHYENEHKALKQERENRMNRAIKLLDLKKGDTLLDLGCGAGALSIRSVKKGAVAYGVDYSRDGIKMANYAKRHLPKGIQKNLKFLEMDCRNLNFPDKYFDKIVCIDVLEHIHEKSIKKVIHEVKRVIKPGGIIVIETAPNRFYLSPVSFFAKILLGLDKFEYDEYHINIYDYFRLKNTLQTLSKDVDLTVLNDSHYFFSSRLFGVKNIPSWIKKAAEFVDFITENPVVEPVILKTPLKIFLAHDLWAVIKMKKNE